MLSGLQKEGADIIAVDVCRDIAVVDYDGATESDLEETKLLVEKLGRGIVTQIVDVRDFTALSEAVSKGVRELGRLDIVSANAGILTFGEVTEEAWSTTLDINLTGVWNTACASVPILQSQGQGGAIIITSSVAAIRTFPNIINYTAAKHGVVGVMRTLAHELADFGIRVNCVHPTNVLTPMIDNGPNFRLMRPDLDTPTRDDAAEGFAHVNRLPIPWIQPIDVSNAVLWLASDEARTLPVSPFPSTLGPVLNEVCA